MKLSQVLKLPQALRREAVLLGAACAGLLLAVLGPHVAQHMHYHAFADQRAWFGLANALDVLSNLPFAVAGVVGLLAWFAAGRMTVGHPNPPQTEPAHPDPARNFAALFFAGLIVTALGSSYYHLNPGDGSLVVDRLGMVASFAGMLGLAAAQRISLRAGLATVVAVLLLGPVSVWVWSESGNLLPWSILQGGGLVMLLTLAACRPINPTANPSTAGAPLPPAVALLPVVLIYTLAKLLELADQPIFELTNHLVSGHSLKHIVAAFAAWPVIRFMHNLKPTLAPKKGARKGNRRAMNLSRSQNSI